MATIRSRTTHKEPDMAKHSVDNATAQGAQGVPVSTQHPALHNMPRSRGAAFASEPPPTRNMPTTPKHTVSNLPSGTPELPSMPVPPSSHYEAPPDQVVAAEPLPTWLA